MTGTRISPAVVKQPTPAYVRTYEAPDGGRVLRIFDMSSLTGSMAQVEFVRHSDGAVTLKNPPRGEVWVEHEDRVSGSTVMSNLGALRYASELPPDSIELGSLRHSKSVHSGCASDVFRVRDRGVDQPEPSIGDRILAELSQRILENARHHAVEWAREAAQAVVQANPGIGLATLSEIESAARSGVESAYIDSAIEKTAAYLLRASVGLNAERLAEVTRQFFAERRARRPQGESQAVSAGVPDGDASTGELVRDECVSPREEAQC